LKPRCAGARILTLDGGGIRGIVELALLQALEKEVGLGVPISELFDLVVGTSTGTLHECGKIVSYTDCSRQAASLRLHLSCLETRQSPR
jgi:patatin-like phospholipase/acyl hydrolase